MCLGAYTEFKVYSTYRDGDRSDFNWPSPTKDLSACFYAIAATVGVAVGSITSITSISIGEIPPMARFNDEPAENLLNWRRRRRCTSRQAIFAVLAVLLIIYLVWIILAGIFIFPLCSNCPIEALWAVLWVVAFLSVAYLGFFLYQDIAIPHGLRKYSGPKRIAIRVGYGIAAAVALLWIVLLIMYGAFFGQVGTHMSGTTTVEGIKGQIRIGLNSHDVVTVKAHDEMDAMYGLGWAHATHRLFQMEIQRRVVRGTMAEVAGEDALPIDKLTRTLGLHRAAQRLIPDLDPELRNALEAYVRGINDFIKKKFKHSVGFKILGFEPNPDFTIADSIAYCKLVSLSLAGNWKSETLRFVSHLERGVSGARLDQLFPMDPQSSVTVISDSAIGDKYSHIPPSTHRNVSLESEVSRLDEFLKTIAKTSLRSVEVAARTLFKSSPARKSSLNSTSTFKEDEFIAYEEEFGKQKIEEEPYLADLIRMISGFKREETSRSIYESASRLMPSFFSPKQGHMKASNNWVVHGSLTEKGKPLLCNDPHLDLTLPSIWMMASINTSTYSVIGASFPLLPAVAIGRNMHFAWGVTNAGTDVQDLFVMDDLNATSYRHNGQIKHYDFFREEIKVKGKSKPLVWVVRESLYGPVVSPISSPKSPYSVSLRWTSLERNDSTLLAFYRLLKAKNWDDFRNALSHYVAPAQNFIFADLEGNIGYQLPGKQPIRVLNHTGTYPVPGTGEYDWQRFSDFWNESLWVYNPPEGYVSSANNMIATEKYPLLILNDRDWEPRYRAERIKDLLESPYKLNTEDMKRIQLDIKSLFATEFISTLRNLPNLSKRAKEWLPKLRQWDGVTDPDSTPALVFESLAAELSFLAEPETGAPFNNPRYWLNMALNRTYPDPICKKERFDCRETISKTFEAALKRRVIGLQSRKTWGDRHATVLRSQVFGNSSVACIFNRRHSAGGSTWTVNVADYDPFTFDTEVGPSYRQIFDLSNWNNAQYSLPGGPSEVVTSPFYASQFRGWIDGNYANLTALDPESVSKFIINPK